MKKESTRRLMTALGSLAVRTAIVFGFVLLLMVSGTVIEKISNSQALVGLLLVAGWACWMYIREGK